MNDKVLPRVGREVQGVGTITGEERLFCAWGEHTPKLYTHFFTFVWYTCFSNIVFAKLEKVKINSNVLCWKLHVGTYIPTYIPMGLFFGRTSVNLILQGKLHLG